MADEVAHHRQGGERSKGPTCQPGSIQESGSCVTRRRSQLKKPKLGDPEPRILCYFSYSAAASGSRSTFSPANTQIVRADIVYDSGKTINAGLDYGQIEGGCVRGVQRFSEELYQTPGQRLSPAAIPPTVAVIDAGLALGGVMMNNEVRKAYVFSKAGATGAWAKEGEEFQGWQIRSIHKTSVKLEQRGLQ